jgi:iron-sulfur cluster assembly accessory protein
MTHPYLDDKSHKRMNPKRFCMTDTRIAEKSVTLTERAAKRIATILAKEKAGTVLRISVAGGGCSGFQYRYDLVPDAPETDDLVIEKAGAIVLIDSLSLEFMGGSEIDFVSDLIGQAFKIDNPNAVASCGCGASFSV